MSPAAFIRHRMPTARAKKGSFLSGHRPRSNRCLGERDAQVFNFFYDVSEDGNFEGKNILNVQIYGRCDGKGFEDANPAEIDDDSRARTASSYSMPARNASSRTAMKRF